jgi:hypothetical protein
MHKSGVLTVIRWDDWPLVVALTPCISASVGTREYIFGEMK